MKAAFAAWENRIAPVFDVARKIHLVETEGAKVIRETQELLPTDLPVQRALRLAELTVDTLVCGAISRPLQEMVAAHGIRIIAFVAGDLQEVIRAWLTGSLDSDAFAMPGCCRHGSHRSGGMRGLYPDEDIVNGRWCVGMGRGGGRSRGQGRQKSDRLGGPFAAGHSNYCVCPQCGETAIHHHGAPCADRKCPKCGAAMIRK